MAFREAPEGIVYSGQTTDGFLTVKPFRYLSESKIEVLDLISEGEIEGLVSGEWNLSGNAGDIGWTTAEFSHYNSLAGTTDLGYLRSIYWNEVPVLNSLGQANFQNVDVSYVKGTPNGGLLNEDNPELTVSRTIGERLRGTELDKLSGEPTSEDVDFSKVYRIFNKDCIAAIVNVKVQSLSRTLTNADGQVVNTDVVYRIYYRPMFNLLNQGPGEETNYQPPVAEEIRGKVNYGYARSTRIDFDTTFADRREFLGWEIKIVRVTPDALQSHLRNQTYIDSITEVYASNFLYPNSSVVRQKFSAEFFQRVPSRAYDTLLLKVKVPSTYDTIYRTYTEPVEGWDGTFKDQKEWTDNPVWCYYDLLTNPRYGLGKYISEANVDKWSLYEASKYCDTLVPDGYGNVEPRFTCNLVLTEREEAYKVVNDMASIFRAITYYGGGTIFAVQDKPKTDFIQFNNTNVENGDFNYSSSAKKARHTVAIVRYNDPQNFFKPAVEYVEDVDGIRRYGIRETEITAFGCTSRGQALRLGRWALLTETLETETVSFIAGLDATYLRPGDVFKIFDSNKKASRHGGRANLIENFTDSANIVLDSTISINTGNHYILSVLTPGYIYDPQSTEGLTSNDTSGIRHSQLQKFTITGIQTTGFSGDNTLIRLYEPFDVDDYSLQRNLVWTLELSSGESETNDFIYQNTDYYRTINVAEKEVNKYEIIGLQYSPQKYLEIESGLSFDRALSTYNVQPEGPAALELVLIDKTPHTKVIDYSFVVDNYTGVTSYRVYAKTGLFEEPLEVPIDNWLVNTPPVDVQFGSYLPSQTGEYYFRVYSANDEINAVSTGYASGNILIEGVNPIRDIIISSLQLETGVEITNDPGFRDVVTYEGDSPAFSWQVGVNDGTSVTSDVTYRITVRSGSSNNTPDSNIIYEVTGYDPIGESVAWTFDFDTNNSIPNGPFRNYDVVVEAMNSDGFTSAGNQVGVVDNQFDNNPFGYDILNVYNPIPTGISLTDKNGINQFDNGYKTTGYVTPNGQITLIFTGDVFPEDVVGGYLYTVKSPPNVNFDSGNAVAGFKGNRTIFRSQFTIDPTLAHPYIFTPSPVQITSAKTNVAVSFFDKFDKAKLDKGKQIYDQLWISDFIQLFQVSEVSDEAIGQAELPEEGTSSVKSVRMSIKTGANESYKFMATNVSGREIIINSFAPV